MVNFSIFVFLMNRRIDLIVNQWGSSNIEVVSNTNEEEVNKIEMNLNDSPFIIYLHSLSPRLITIISLIKLKRYPENDNTSSKIKQMIKCLKIINMSQWSIFNGVLLYLQILKNKLGKLINSLVNVQQVLNGQFNNLILSVIKGYIRRFHIEFGADVVILEEDQQKYDESLFSIINIIKSCIVNKRVGTLNLLFPTKILMVIKTVDDLIEFLEINSKNYKFNINLFNDWRLEEMNDNLNKLQINLKDIGFNNLKKDLTLLLDRYDALSESNDDIKKQFKISSPIINEKRRSSGLQFSLVKVYNED